MSKKGTCWFCGPSTMGEKPKLSPVHEHIWYYNHRYKTFSVSQGTSSALYLYKCNTYHYSDLFSVNKHFWSHLISSATQRLLLLSRVLHRAKWPWLRSDERGGVSSLWSLLNQSPPSNPLSSLSSYFHLPLSRFYLLLFGWWEMIIEKKKKWNVIENCVEWIVLARFY